MNPDTLTTKEVQTILSQEPEFETSISPDDSPLLRPIVDKTASGPEVNSPFDFPQNSGPMDAPQQPIGEPEKEKKASEPQAEIPTDAAMFAAKTFLGMFNNVVALGAGRFIRLEMKEDFYDIEGFATFVDEHNQRNLQRLKLDEEDKEMLQPLIAEMIRKYAVQISVEKQLVAVVVNILIKKAQLFMSLRAENKRAMQKLEALVESAKQNPVSSEEVREEVFEEPEEVAAEEVV